MILNASHIVRSARAGYERPRTHSLSSPSSPCLDLLECVNSNDKVFFLDTWWWFGLYERRSSIITDFFFDTLLRYSVFYTLKFSMSVKMCNLSNLFRLLKLKGSVIILKPESVTFFANSWGRILLSIRLFREWLLLCSNPTPWDRRGKFLI